LKSSEQSGLAVFVSRDGQSFGPYSWEELWGHFQTGTVVGTDLAWHEGQAEWIPVEQLFAPKPSPTPILTPMPTPETVKPVGPLFIAGSTEAKPLADPSALSASTPKTVEKPKEDPKPKAEAKGKRQDFQLPRWSKWALVGGVLLSVVVYWFFINPPVPEVDLQTQIFGQAVRDSLNKHEGDLVDDDYKKVKKLEIRGKEFTALNLLSKCPELETLYLSGNKVPVDLSSLPDLSKLEKLDLSQNKINDFTPLEKFSSLKELVIEGNPGASKSTKDALKATIPGITFPKTLSK
jgi:hypothetical protein